jgi:TonB family protein
MDKNAVLWPVIISIGIHLTLLAVAGVIDLSDNIHPVEVLAVNISGLEPEEKPAPQKASKTEEQKKKAESKKEQGSAIKNEDGWREETVDLGSLDIKYVNYLAKVKNKILLLWKYPQKSYERNEEGDSIVKMSLNADGTLAGITLMSSSGYGELDDSALSVVQMAAPFEPLPAFYNLSRLNIVASFEYRIMD